MGESRWIDKNDGPVGTVNFASRILDYNSKDILADNRRFRIPNEMEPGDHFSGEISVPLSISQPRTYWLKFDLVSEKVCWFETLGSKAVLVEIKVEA